MIKELRPQERKLFSYLKTHLDKVITHEDIRKLLGGETFAQGRLNVYRIRRVLEKHPEAGLAIISIHGHGYRMVRRSFGAT